MDGAAGTARLAPTAALPNALQDAPKPDQRLRYDRTQGLLPPPGLRLHAQQLAVAQVGLCSPGGTLCSVGQHPQPFAWLICGGFVGLWGAHGVCGGHTVPPGEAGAQAAAL